MRLSNATFLIMAATIFSGEAISAPRIAVHGHRGARAVRPENTMPAFEYAINAGVDALELDLAVTRDNVLVVSHDPVLPEAICSGGKGARVIREMTLAELRQWDCGSRINPQFPKQTPAPGARVPALEEVLALAPRGKFHFNLETKISQKAPQYTPSPEEFSMLLIEAVRKHKLEDRVIIQSFDFRTLRAARKIAPSIRRAALYMGPPRDLIAMTREAEATMLSPHYTLVTKALAGQAHAAGFPVVPWTPNTPAEWDKLIEAGVDAIITDDPAALIAHLKSKGLR